MAGGTVQQLPLSLCRFIGSSPVGAIGPVQIQEGPLSIFKNSYKFNHLQHFNTSKTLTNSTIFNTSTLQKLLQIQPSSTLQHFKNSYKFNTLSSKTATNSTIFNFIISARSYMDHTPKQWANAAFWLVVKLTLFRLAIAGVALVLIVIFIHEANSNAEWVPQLFGIKK